jgi:predicted SprT family Zn-dependent metalloprotease
MTQEQVKANLLKLHDCTEEFTLVFSGKKNRRTNGNYFSADVKILINNRNFEEGEAGDNLLFYTAMHELAHHIQFTEKHQDGVRCHTKLFYSILNDLTDKAEKLGLYRYDADKEVKKLIEEANFMSAQIALLQRELGGVLKRLQSACLRKGVRYEDVVERKVRLSMRTEKKLQKIADLRLPDTLRLPEGGVGFETQEVIAGAKSDGSRSDMIKAAAESKSVAQVKQAGSGKKEEEDELATLVREKERISSSIENLKRRFAAVVKRITQLEGGG